MKHGFIKVAAATPKIKVADVSFNTKAIIDKITEAYGQGARIIVLPELCITGYTCQDLFAQELLVEAALEGLRDIMSATADMDALIFVGLPMEKTGKLYNVAAAIFAGEVLGFIPKRYIPMHHEFYEGRYFVEGNEHTDDIYFDGKYVPFGTDILFEVRDGILKGLSVACEICEDLWAPMSPSLRHGLAGANVIVNLSASSENVGKDIYRHMLVTSTSARLMTGYIYCSAGEGESTQDMVFGGHNMICENGTMLAETKRFSGKTIYAELDIHRMRHERRGMSSFKPEEASLHRHVYFTLPEEETVLDRYFDPMPFVPSDVTKRALRCEEILSIQAYGLKKRLEHTNCKHAVIGISGGLDSTLAMLVTARAFDLLGLDRTGIHAITMPGFGTTDRTYDNACTLVRTLGATLEEIDIKNAVTVHFKDINHDIDNHNVTYENAQARERTQILMDIANRENGMVIGTGDMSELALGWATYNGDHMSMYGVNAGVPKTLVRHLVQYYADTCGNAELNRVLLDVLDTPVSPELLPPVDGAISQKTEDLVGPYELHDFFLYYMLRCGFTPSKVYRVACKAFAGQYDEATILKWLKTFYRRFFTQQFKRSCLPDGPKVGSVGVSPRGDLRMPSDACMSLWMAELERL